MKEKNPKKVVIINDIDSKSIEKAILILRSGARPLEQTYHIVTEAQELINSYRKTIDKTQLDLSRREHRIRRAEKSSAVFFRVLWATGFMALFLFGGYLTLQGFSSLLEKF